MTTDRSQCALAPADREAFFPDLTMNAVTTFEACAAVPALPAADLEIAKGFARASKAAATRRAYQKDFARFTAWCAERHLPAIPAAPETVAAFLAAEAARGIKPATIGRRVAAIRYAHKLAGCDDPPTSSEVVKATVQGIRRTLGAAPVRKSPVTADKVVAMAALADTDMKGLPLAAASRNSKMSSGSFHGQDSATRPGTAPGQA